MPIVTSKEHGTGCGCGSCTIAAFTRNNYFTGKLLLERDFTDEQQYFRDKIRHHNQRLHGTGVVCGLLAHQHPNESCRDRFVRLTPGTAIDCCGNEILLASDEDVELATLPAIAAMDPDDEALHDVQLCLRYHECGNEPVPVLYDECGCDDDRCLPNRILESFRVDAVVDPPVQAQGWSGPSLVRFPDLPFAEPFMLRALPGGRLLVGDGTSVHLADPDGGTPTVTNDLGQTLHGLDLAPGGSFYVTSTDAAGDLSVSVLDGSLAVTHQVAVPGGSPATTAMLADGRFVLLQSATGALTVYGTDLEGGNPAPPTSIAVDKFRSLLAAHPSAASVYVAADAASADPDPGRIDGVDLGASTVSELTTMPAGVRVTTLTTLATGGAAYALVGTDDHGLGAFDLSDGSDAGSVTLTGPLTALAGSPWAYAALASGGQSLVQPVGVDRLVAGRSDAVGPALGFEGDATSVAVADGTVYVGYAGTGNDPGGVAVFDVISRSCRGAWDTLGDCPHCEQPDCVVVATIHGYRPGFFVLDADEAADAAEDAAAHVARIDNLAGRTRLRSTATLEAAIECLLDGGTPGGPGGTGPQGPPGKDGKDGKDGTNGKNGKDGVDGHDGADGTDGQNGTDGRDGEGLEAGLTQIVELSWRHGEKLDLGRRIVIDEQGVERHGLVVLFSREVDASRMDAAHVFTVDAPNPFAPGQAQELGLRCRCPLHGDVQPVEILSEAGGLIDQARVIPGAQFAKAVAFVFDDVVESLVKMLQDRADLAVRINGEFVVDDQGRAIDAEFTRAELPTGDRPSGSDFGVQGGLFQSWFLAVLG